MECPNRPILVRITLVEKTTCVHQMEEQCHVNVLQVKYYIFMILITYDYLPPLASLMYIRTLIGFSNDDPNDPWACVRAGSNSGVIVRGSSDESLIDIPSRTAQDDFVRSPNRDKDARPTTTDRPSFLPPKETVIGI